MWVGRLMKCYAVRAAQSDEQVCRIDAGHVAVGKEFCQDAKGFSIGRVAKSGNQDSSVSNIEICVACRQSPFLEIYRFRHWKFYDVRRCAIFQSYVF